MKTCTKCGETKPLEEYHRRANVRDGRTSSCKACVSEQKREHHSRNRKAKNEACRAYYHANKEKLLEYQRDYRAANSDLIAERRAEYNSRNRDAVIERSRAYYAANRESVLEKARIYRAEHRAERAEAYRAWAAENPGYWWERRYIDRAASFGFEPVVESFTWDELISCWGDACYLCGGAWDQLEHVTPVSRGGEHSLSNCRPVCGPCNRRAWVEFRRAETA